MDSKEREEISSKDAEGAGEPVIDSVARGIGTAIGVVASTAAKVIGKSESAEPEPKAPEPKAKEKPRKSAKPKAAADQTGDKHSASRIAKKKKKRAAHRSKLKRSNTKG
ncbi:MAG: hypothetical protein ACRD2U_07080 [Terriglobales bacterium]